MPKHKNAAKIEKAKTAANNKIQYTLRAKRKESGLEGVTIYLDAPTKKRLGELCVKNGYTNPIEHRRSGTDALSNTIGALIHEASEVSYKLACSKKKLHQELYRLRTIVLHRKNKHKHKNKNKNKNKNKKKESNAEIAKFMEAHGYPSPYVAAGLVDVDEVDAWSEADIETLIDKPKLRQLIVEAEEEEEEEYD